jgi:hypothetical protein
VARAAGTWGADTGRREVDDAQPGERTLRGGPSCHTVTLHETATISQLALSKSRPDVLAPVTSVLAEDLILSIHAYPEVLNTEENSGGFSKGTGARLILDRGDLRGRRRRSGSEPGDKTLPRRSPLVGDVLPQGRVRSRLEELTAGWLS